LKKRILIFLRRVKRMALIQVPYFACDWPGCPKKWPIHSKNDSMLLIWGVDPRIIRSRFGFVILHENEYNFCQDHAIEVRDTLVPEAIKKRGQIGPDFEPDMGCWVTAWIFDGRPNQLILNHQYPYEEFEELFRFYTVNILSPKDCEDQKKVFI
jgi:hypothetical protein